MELMAEEEVDLGGVESKLASARKAAMENMGSMVVENMELMAEEVDLGGVESKLASARKAAMENMELMAGENMELMAEEEVDLGMGMGKMGMGMMGMGKMGMMGMGKMGMMGMGAPQDDEAAAVGDPHMTLTGGEQDDLCCNGGHCEPCPLALFSKVDSAELNLAAGREAALASMHVE